MTTRDKVIEKLILKARGLGIHVDEKGYVETLEGNLIEQLSVPRTNSTISTGIAERGLQGLIS